MDVQQLKQKLTDERTTDEIEITYEEFNECFPPGILDESWVDIGSIFNCYELANAHGFRTENDKIGKRVVFKRKN